MNQVICTDDYHDWLQSMYVLFGTKLFKMLCGPMWSQDPTSQDSVVSNTHSNDPQKVHQL